MKNGIFSSQNERNRKCPVLGIDHLTKSQFEQKVFGYSSTRNCGLLGNVKENQGMGGMVKGRFRNRKNAD
jgi:hypothetical protein